MKENQEKFVLCVRVHMSISQCVFTLSLQNCLIMTDVFGFCGQSQLTATLLASVVAAVFGSLQIGYHTGNVNSPARVST